MFAAVDSRGEPTELLRQLLNECKDVVDGLSKNSIQDLDVLFAHKATKVEALTLKIDLGLSDRKYQLLANYLAPGILPNLGPVKDTAFARCPIVKFIPTLKDASILASTPKLLQHDLVLLVGQMGINE